MNACSYSIFTLSASSPLISGSDIAVSGPPARLSSQFGPHSTFIALPVSCECDVATGSCFCSGALISVS